jgi:hypothetical protein
VLGKQGSALSKLTTPKEYPQMPPEATRSWRAEMESTMHLTSRCFPKGSKQFMECLFAYQVLLLQKEIIGGFF